MLLIASIPSHNSLSIRPHSIAPIRPRLTLIYRSILSIKGNDFYFDGRILQSDSSSPREKFSLEWPWHDENRIRCGRREPMPRFWYSCGRVHNVKLSLVVREINVHCRGHILNRESDNMPTRKHDHSALQIGTRDSHQRNPLHFESFTLIVPSSSPSLRRVSDGQTS